MLVNTESLLKKITYHYIEKILFELLILSKIWIRAWSTILCNIIYTAAKEHHPLTRSQVENAGRYKILVSIQNFILWAECPSIHNNTFLSFWVYRTLYVRKVRISSLKNMRFCLSIFAFIITLMKNFESQNSALVSLIYNYYDNDYVSIYKFLKDTK